MPVLGNARFTHQSSALPSGVTMPGVFHPHLGLYLPTGFTGLPRAQAGLARARAGGAPFHIGIIGDSITRGAIGGASSPPTLSYPGRLIPLLSRLGTVQEGYIIGNDGAQDTRVTFGTGWGQSGAFGAGGMTGNSPAGTLTVAPTATGTVVKVQYVKRAVDSGTISVRVDGGTATTASLNAGAAVDMGLMTITGLANTTHSVGITVTGAGGNCWVTGVSVQQATGGAIVSRWGRDGVNTPAATGATNKWEHIGAPLETGLDLVIVNFSTNDWFFNNVTPATTQTSMTGYLSPVNAKGADLVYMTPGLSDPTSPVDPTKNQKTWIQAIYNAAEANSCPVIDVAHRWGAYSFSSTTAQGYLGSGNGGDAEHPSQRGYLDMAETIDRALAVLL